MPSYFFRIVGLSLLFVTLGTGCVATVRTRPAYAVYEEDDYPHTYYRGRPVYYIDGYWHYRSGSSWVVAFRDEPVELREYRGRVRHAPSARSYDRRHRHERSRPVERRNAPSADRYR